MPSLHLECTCLMFLIWYYAQKIKKGQCNKYASSILFYISKKEYLAADANKEA